MGPRDVNTVADARRIVEERGLDHVKVGVFDVDGILRGKYMSRAKFLSALDSGFGASCEGIDRRCGRRRHAAQHVVAIHVEVFGDLVDVG